MPSAHKNSGCWVIQLPLLFYKLYLIYWQNSIDKKIRFVLYYYKRGVDSHGYQRELFGENSPFHRQRHY